MLSLQPEIQMPNTPRRPGRRRIISNSAFNNPQENFLVKKLKIILLKKYHQVIYFNGYVEYLDRRQGIIEKNINFLSNKDGELVNRLYSMIQKKNTLKIPSVNNQRAGGNNSNSGELVIPQLLSENINITSADPEENIIKNPFEVFYDVLMEKKELFNKKTLKQSKLQKFMRGIFKKNCKYTTSGSQRTQLNNVGNLRVESG